ncbi:MAG: FeoA family protein [Promethearchaeota archaeon]
MLKEGKQKEEAMDSLIPLDMLDYNTKAVIVAINAGRGAVRRLSGLGLVPGTIITKISEAPLRGPVQISVRNTRLAIGRGLAHKVLVRIIK